MKTWLQKITQFLPFGPKKAVSQLIDTTENLPEEKLSPWWGTFLIEEEQSRYFKIGNLTLCLDRFNHQWQITSYREEKKPFKTFAAQTPNEITLKPTLPDRPLLTRLARPFYIPKGEDLLLYISSPLWISIEAGHPISSLEEIEIEKLTDTWFGKNTLEGELCYANQTYCSLSLYDLLRDTTRVVIPILIENRSKETLCLHELKAPLPFLSIYSDDQNYLWTEQLSIYQTESNNLETNVIKDPPKPLKNIELLSPPRAGIKSGSKTLLSSLMWR